MAEESVGQIGLDLVVNKQGFDKAMKGVESQAKSAASALGKSMGGIQTLAKKAAGALAAVFAVKNIVGFSAACLELGSDLQEVQNVVDVTFSSMSEKVNEFARNSLKSIGMSETMAKQYTGTIGAMAKAFGFSEQQAYDMGTTLTSLAGDVASFYNLSQDEAFSKLKAVFTGETESLKSLGVVMTQTALDAYAMANGYGKTTKQMSEAEKVALRYAFVQDQLAAAQGDFTRTSGGWANQVRVLSLQFAQLKATIGQGLIAALTPVIKVINQLIGKIMTLANAFKALMESLFGKQEEASGAAVSAAAMEAADASEATADSTAETAANLKKASKFLASFDEVNKVSSPDSGAGNGADSPVSGADISAIDMSGYITGQDQVSEATDEIGKKFEALKKKLSPVVQKAKELAGVFVDGFWSGFKEDTDFSGITSDLTSIGESVQSFFSDEDVKTAASNFLDATASSFGQINGAIASIGKSSAENIVGGVEYYLGDEANQDRIKSHVTAMFDIGSETETIAGNFAEACATIFEPLGGEAAQQATGNLIGVVNDAGMALTELGSKIGRDTADGLTKPIVENQEALATAVDGTMEIINQDLGTLKELVDNTGDGINQTYDEHIHPLSESLSDGVSDLTGELVDGYNNDVLPVLSGISAEWHEVYENNIQPLIDAFLEWWGKVCDAIKYVWETYILPYARAFIENVWPIIKTVIQNIWNIVKGVFQTIVDVVKNIIKIFSGIIDFFIGVFSGDWSRAWEGIKGVFSGVWGVIRSIGEGIINFFKNTFVAAWTAIVTTVQNIVTNIIAKIKLAIQRAKEWLTNTIQAIKTGVVNAFTFLKEKISGIMEKIKNALKVPINAIIGFINKLISGVVSGINGMIRALNKLHWKIPDWVPFLGGKEFGFSIGELTAPQIPTLAQGGYVEANTPQLAVIGDNKREGEIVSPEGKLREMAQEAAAGNLAMLQRIIELLQTIISIIQEGGDIVLMMDALEVARAVMNKQEQLKRRYTTGTVTV